MFFPARMALSGTNDIATPFSGLVHPGAAGEWGEEQRARGDLGGVPLRPAGPFRRRGGSWRQTVGRGGHSANQGLAGAVGADRWRFAAEGSVLDAVAVVVAVARCSSAVCVAAPGWRRLTGLQFRAVGCRSVAVSQCHSVTASQGRCRRIRCATTGPGAWTPRGRGGLGGLPANRPPHQRDPGAAGLRRPPRHLVAPRRPHRPGQAQVSVVGPCGTSAIITGRPLAAGTCRAITPQGGGPRMGVTATSRQPLMGVPTRFQPNCPCPRAASSCAFHDGRRDGLGGHLDVRCRWSTSGHDLVTSRRALG